MGGTVAEPPHRAAIHESCRPIRWPLQDAEGEWPGESGGGERASVAYCESFEVEAGTVNFCVKCWRARPGSPSRYELTVLLKLCGGGLHESMAGLRSPVLLWDVDGQAPFNWAPPPQLPSTTGRHEVDHARRCMVTTFVPAFGSAAAPGSWMAVLVWPCSNPFSGVRGAPQKVSVQIQMADGRRIVHPVHGRTFTVIMRRGHAPKESADLLEARSELEYLRAKSRKADAVIAEWKARDEEYDRQISQRPAMEDVTEYMSRLGEEITHRRRCQADLMELRGRPRAFCLFDGAHGRPSALERRGRTEVWVPSLSQGFEYDFVLDAQGGVDAAWSEVEMALDVAIRQPGSHTCIVLCGQQESLRSRQAGLPHRASRGHIMRHGLVLKTLKHFFESFVQDQDGHSPSSATTTASGASYKLEDSSKHGSAAMSLVTIDQEQLHDELRGSSDSVWQPAAPGGSGPQQLTVLRPCTWQEAFGAFERAGSSGRLHGHGVLSLSAERLEPRSREAAGGARLSILILRDLHEPPGPGACDDEAAAAEGAAADAQAIRRSLADVIRTVQVCLDSTAETCGGGACGQPKLLLMASVSACEEDLAESLATLQLVANAQTLHERASLRTEHDQCRKQLVKLGGENERLRNELQERLRRLHGTELASARTPEAAAGRSPKGSRCRSVPRCTSPVSRRRGLDVPPRSRQGGA